MFDVGFWELIFIAVITLLVVGPERLPKLARTAGMWLGRLRVFISSVKRDIDRELAAEELGEAIDKQLGLPEMQDLIDEVSGKPLDSADQPAPGQEKTNQGVGDTHDNSVDRATDEKKK